MGKIPRILTIMGLASLLVVTFVGCAPAVPALTSITASPVPVSLTAGGIMQLKITASYTKGETKIVTTGTYSSSNATVATVTAEGLVMAGVAGSATITVSYNEGGVNKTVMVPVTVPGTLRSVPGAAHQSE